MKDYTCMHFEQRALGSPTGLGLMVKDTPGGRLIAAVCATCDHLAWVKQRELSR